MKPLLVITGASRGIAKATAEYFFDHGWEVVNLSRHACDVTGVTNIKVDFIQQEWELNATKVLKAFFENNNRHLCLVHSAATSCHDTIQNLDPHQLEKMFAVNVLPPPKTEPTSFTLYGSKFFHYLYRIDLG